ncbi:MAG: hypothetical protein CSB06_00215 [Bacteroidia bacterium]|nr:MAG: hypothetical protein CSB06_00215 [Bacteroidia bacterium]
MLLAGLLLIGFFANAQNVGDKFKAGKLYYKITKLNPTKEVEVSSQNSNNPYWDNAEKPTGEITIPQTVKDNDNNTYNVTAIGSQAFYFCRSLTSITIPNSVVSIGEKAFVLCLKLTSILVAEENLFYSSEEGILFNEFRSRLVCYPAGKKETTYNIPSSVECIVGGAFYFASSLTSITIPENVTSFGKAAFFRCYGLTSIHSKIKDPTPSVVMMGGGVFAGVDTKRCKLYVPKGTIEKYKSAGQWKSFENIIDVEVTGISLSETKKELKVGETATLTATVEPSDATNKNVTWISNNYKIAKVDKNGLVTAVSEGTAIIKAYTYDYEKNATCEVTVTKGIGTVAVTGVSLSETTKELKVGETATLTATVEPNDATNKNVTWSSSDVNIATVDVNGLVTAVAEGTVTITVTTEDGSKTATCEITVTPKTIAVTKVTLNPKTAELKVGETATLTATVEPNDATNKNVTWSSSDDNIATVDVNGLVTAVAEGTATITVTTEDGSKTATCEIAVTPKTIAVTKVTLNPKTAELKVGETATLTATVEPSDATNKSATWSSDNESVATVDATGLVTAVAQGNADIVVKTEDGGFTDTCKVTVTPKAIAVTKVTLSPATAELKVGETATLTATVEPSDATNKSVTWSSDNESVATVDATGLVTAVAEGTATITVTTEDGSKTATCTVTVSNKSTGIEDINSSAFKLYPNPAKEGFTIESSERGILEIFNLSGSKVIGFQVTSDKQFIDVSCLQSGTYFAKINGKTIKFVKK